MVLKVVSVGGIFRLVDTETFRKFFYKAVCFLLKPSQKLWETLPAAPQTAFNNTVLPNVDWYSCYEPETPAGDTGTPTMSDQVLNSPENGCCYDLLQLPSHSPGDDLLHRPLLLGLGIQPLISSLLIPHRCDFSNGGLSVLVGKVTPLPHKWVLYLLQQGFGASFSSSKLVCFSQLTVQKVYKNKEKSGSKEL